MACPPGRIQIRRDTYQAWNASNPVLAPGELGYMYPYVNIPAGIDYPDGVLKIGGPSGSTWSTAKIILPQTGSGGGGGTQGPPGTASFQMVAISGTPIITKTFSSGYNVTISTSGPDQVACVNPDLFDITTHGVVFKCTLPDTASIGSSAVHVGFGDAYAIIDSQTISYYVDDVFKTSTGYGTVSGKTLSITYTGANNVIFNVFDTSLISSTTYPCTATQDYGYIAFSNTTTSTTVQINNVNMYATGGTGKAWAPTTLEKVGG